jgi:3-methyl-2-oxobutanoate hydroxymethyltransferase
VRGIVDAGIPVQGHLGLTPQNVTQLGGYKVQGATRESARAIVADAIALADAGIFSLILETVPAPLADALTANLGVPTIGTGSGAGCDGQNLITPDALTYYNEDFAPRYIKRFANVTETILTGLAHYRLEVLAGTFPGVEHTYPVKNPSFLEGVFDEFGWQAGGAANG